MSTEGGPQQTDEIIDLDDSSDSESNHGAASSSASDTTQKPRNIALKKGSPAVLPKISSGKKGDLNLLEGSKFLDNFNPENSKREKNKRYNLTRPKPTAKKGGSSMYDEVGRIRLTKEDVCDCFEMDCPGCHFTCEGCGSQKCGVRCRVNRKWAFEAFEHDGKDIVKMNPLLTSVSRN